MTYIHPADDRYGRKIGGRRYKKWTPPEPLAITILKLTAAGVAFTAISILSHTFLPKSIKGYLKYEYDEAGYYEFLDKKRIQRSLIYLKRKRFVAFPGKGRFIITRKGTDRLLRININQIVIKRVPWDGPWRILTFDIPEEKEPIREYFRRRLKEIGFYHFQRSVFIIPHPCEKELDTMCSALGIETNVHLLTTDRFAGDDDIKKYFQLK